MTTHTSPATPHAATPQTSADLAHTAALAPHGLSAFFVIAFAFSWITWWAGSHLLSGGDPMPVVLVGGFGPAVAAVIVTAATQGRSGVGALFRRYAPLRNRGGLMPYAITALLVLALVGSAAFPIYLQGTQVDQTALDAALALVPVQFLLIALAGGGNEELGWRGFALPRLQGALPPLAANVVLGAIWAVWHAPLFHMAGTLQSEMYFPAYALLCVGLTVVFGHVFNSARGGLFAAVLVHTSVNVISSLKGAAVADPAGFGEVTMVALVALILALSTRCRLGLRQADHAERQAH